MAKFQPIIKWSGSKRSQSDEILKYFPKEIDTYYEPFCGGASILFSLLKNENIKVNRYVISDINEDLIYLWRMIKNDPNTLKTTYRKLWTTLYNKNTQLEKRTFFEEIRNIYNKSTQKDPAYFLFLNRTCFNGLIRYNSFGEFNTSFHLNRNGIHPDKLDKIIDEWSGLFNDKNVEIFLRDYSEVIPKFGDFIYFDPPYASTKGMYYNNFDQISFFEYLNNLTCSYILSYDGISGEDNHIVDIPKSIYDECVLIKSGNSSFKRLIEKDKGAIVYESLYIKK